MHPLEKSREFGCTEEATCIKPMSPSEITDELSTPRYELAYFRDSLRKLGLLHLYGEIDDEVIAAKGDALLRWSAFPGASMYFCGAHGAGKAVYESNVNQNSFEAQLAYHTRILKALGTVVYHPGFAYAMDVEAPGKVDPHAKRLMQARLIEGLRAKWPNLTFLCSTRNWSNPPDLIGYELPAENCIARLCFYEPFNFTHWNDKSFGQKVPPPNTLNKDSMRKILRECKATGLPFLITEAGVFRNALNAKDAARWRVDLKSACYSEGVALMEYALGYSKAPKGEGWGLGVGLE